MASKILVVDTLRNIEPYGYRFDFWQTQEKSFDNVVIDIPREHEGDIVSVAANGSVSKIDVGPYDLLIIHESDDRNTGYESLALKAGKSVILYSDGFLDDAKCEAEGRLLKIKARLLYPHLSGFLSHIQQTESVDLQELYITVCNFDPSLEELLQPFAIADPFKKDPKLTAAIGALEKRAKEVIANRQR